jgi:hypothetical protein
MARSKVKRSKQILRLNARRSEYVPQAGPKNHKRTLAGSNKK